MSDPLDVSVAAAASALAAARDVTLLAHVSPDADALGSALALGTTLARRGAVVRVAFASPASPPVSLRALDVDGLLVPPSAVPAAPELLVTCDAAEPARLGGLADRLATAGRTVMIDHHASNPGFGDVQVLDRGAEATALLAHRVLRAMSTDPIDVDVATCLYAGIVTDTRGFRTAGAGALRVAAELVEAGVDAAGLVRSLMDTHPFAWFAVLGRALERAELDRAAAGGAGLVHVVLPVAETSGFGPEEIDGVVDELRTAAEAEVALVLKEVGERRYTGSLRSTGTVDVAAAAIALGGGGHRAAAGFTATGTAVEVLTRVREALAETVP